MMVHAPIGTVVAEGGTRQKRRGTQLFALIIHPVLH